ncbi:phospholipase D-like domain-containing protein [Nitratireductor basaltis]|uniref:Phospholipase D n=1 Tax=Nitratireductor basaltis TaxID=472175 RepID=A0A084UAU8_9HYPH|nr:phospholipase D-like domain-containing protein [Nitratireductor basaltis]KFB10084.1 Phospholipase D/Transphosphatidylase [Nitratireductor basaltis]
MDASADNMISTNNYLNAKDAGQRQTQSARSEAAASAGSILRPGRNVWRIEKATRLKFLVDGEAYFTMLEQALRNAKRSIWIIGWDFNGNIRLHPDQGEKSVRLGNLIREAVEENEDLTVRILVWRLGSLYSQKKILQKEPWREHPRILVRYDGKHPLRASHHQKLVCLDDSLAFTGGMDLTVHRWDRRPHRPYDPDRVTEDGEAYEPVHDTQIALEGVAAKAIGDLARERWRRATGERHQPEHHGEEIWPDGFDPDLKDCEIGIARTLPSMMGFQGRREAGRLNYDVLRAARKSIYIETQYLASRPLGRLLEKRLAEPDGPEVVILVTESSRGLFEQFVMGGNRDRIIRRLMAADRNNRLRVYYPVAVDETSGKEQEILIHAKVLIVDDRFLRIGSSNLNHRSEGLDTECDVAIEARSPQESQAVEFLRNDLLAEHVGVPLKEVESAVYESGSLVSAIDRLNVGNKHLRPFNLDPGGEKSLLFGTAVLDPLKPYWPLQKVRVLPHRIRSWASRLFS